MVCFFLSLLKLKLPQGCPKRGGGGQGHFWTMSKRKQLFLGMTSLRVVGNIWLWLYYGGRQCMEEANRWW